MRLVLLGRVWVTESFLTLCRDTLRVPSSRTVHPGPDLGHEAHNKREERAQENRVHSGMACFILCHEQSRTYKARDHE